MERLRPFGDAALLVETGDHRGASSIAQAIEEARARQTLPAAVREVVVGSTSALVELDGGGRDDDLAGAEAWLAALAARTGAGDLVRPPPRAGARHHDVWSVFDGPDLGAVAGELGSAADDVVDLLCSVELEVAFVGFAPGFPYLVGLPTELASLERHSTPRVSVPAGSVAVAGGFASVYPRASPGGWRLLGRSELALFDPQRAPYALLRPGDTVRFRPRTSMTSEPVVPAAGGRMPLAARGPRFVEVLRPGLLSLVEDGGRRLAALGVPRAGPCDRDSMRLANRLVGNDDDAGSIEVTVTGPSIRCSVDCHVAVVAPDGASVDVRLDGHRAPTGVVVPVGAGQVLEVGGIRGAFRAYLAVSGGFDSPATVGSCSSDLLSGLGPGPLVTGDRLDLGPPGRPRGQATAVHRSHRPHRSEHPVELRVLAGPHGSVAALADLTREAWQVGDAANRIGIRLRGDGGVRTGVTRVPSTGMVTGAVQVPPDGSPIVLLPDHATVGGYPAVACVVTADLPRLGQLGPGDPVRFSPVDLPEARRLRHEADRAFERRVRGWFPTTAAT